MCRVLCAVTVTMVLLQQWRFSVVAPPTAWHLDVTSVCVSGSISGVCVADPSGGRLSACGTRWLTVWWFNTDTFLFLTWGVGLRLSSEWLC